MKYARAQTLFKDADERTSVEQWCREAHGRSFSSQSRHLILQAMRKDKEAQKKRGDIGNA